MSPSPQNARKTGSRDKPMQTNKAPDQNPIRPQNKSCPAGSTNQTKKHPNQRINHTPRGVVVAPPSRNTYIIPDMTILHQGFDTIALSIKATLTPDFLTYLESEQARAKTDNASVLCSYGDVEFHLKHHGGAGYQFLLDGGPDGASWAFKRPHPKDPWGIRISIGSRFLALNGLGRAKAHVEDTLEACGASASKPRMSVSPVLTHALMYSPQSLFCSRNTLSCTAELDDAITSPTVTRR